MSIRSTRQSTRMENIITRSATSSRAVQLFDCSAGFDLSDNLLKDMSRLITKLTKWHVRPAKTQISLGIRPVWSESSLSAWRKLGSLATRWAHSEDSDQTGRMPRLIWVFAGFTIILLVLSWGGSYVMVYSGIRTARTRTFQIFEVQKLVAKNSVPPQRYVYKLEIGQQWQTTQIAAKERSW